MMQHFTVTDYVFLGLLLILVTSVLWSLREEATRSAFQRLIQQPLAVSAGLILLFFFSIAVMDSIHLATDKLSERSTLLDYVLSPLSETYEDTFSAPLALKAYTPEVTFKGGKLETSYPLLTYPQATLPDEKAKTQYIGQQIRQAFLWTALIGIALFLLKRKKSKAYWSGLLTLVLLVFCIILLYGLSRHLHVFGTSKIGEDIFYAALKSIRTGLVIGILTTLFTLPFALLLGVAAGYFGGWVDDVIQYLYTTLSSIPGVLLISASILSMQSFIANHPTWFTTLAQQADVRLLALCFILGVSSWTSLCRLLRAEALKLKHIDYVLAARVLGVSAYRILTRHLLPNVLHIIMITLVLDFSYLILAEAVLTYVGVGVSPMTMSFGNMINSARLELAREPVVWWPITAAFLLMFTLVLASNVFADAVEKAWNPRSEV